MDNIKTDILIVGAGAAGIATSLSASKTCNNIILAEQLSYVGGLITGGLVTMFCGMEGNESSILQDVLRELKKYNGVLDTKDGPIVNPEIFKIAVEGMLIDKGVKILYNSQAYIVVKQNEKITKVFFKNNCTTFTVEPKVVIDCTGNGDIFYYCNEPFKEYYSKDIPIGLVVRIGGISEEVEKYLFSGAGKAFLEKESILGFEKTKMKSILWTIVNYSEPLDGYGKEEHNNLTEILIHLRKKALRVSINLRKNKILKDSFLLDTAPLLGIRVSRLLRGKSILTNKYIEPGTVVRADKSGIYVMTGPKRKDDVNSYILPKYTKNLLVAGRCISAELPVMDKMRVIPACFATGEMAGVAATLMIKGGGK